MKLIVTKAISKKDGGTVGMDLDMGYSASTKPSRKSPVKTVKPETPKTESSPLLHDKNLGGRHTQFTPPRPEASQDGLPKGYSVKDVGLSHGGFQLHHETHGLMDSHPDDPKRLAEVAHHIEGGKAMIGAYKKSPTSLAVPHSTGEDVDKRMDTADEYRRWAGRSRKRGYMSDADADKHQENIGKVHAVLQAHRDAIFHAPTAMDDEVEERTKGLIPGGYKIKANEGGYGVHHNGQYIGQTERMSDAITHANNHHISGKLKKLNESIEETHAEIRMHGKKKNHVAARNAMDSLDGLHAEHARLSRMMVKAVDRKDGGTVSMDLDDKPARLMSKPKPTGEPAPLFDEVPEGKYTKPYVVPTAKRSYPEGYTIRQGKTAFHVYHGEHGLIGSHATRDGARAIADKHADAMDRKRR